MKEMSSERQQPPPPSGDPLKCPRCSSFDTKFCYYNNYSTTQPRHFCKNCKRYWTAGGSLRNVPVGGGLRKNKKAKLAKQQQQSGDMASASSDEHFHAPNPRHGLVNPNSNTDGFPYSDSTRGPFMLGSPSSSADAGAIEENLANCNGNGLQYSASPNFRYLETPLESYYTGDYTSSGFSNPYLVARNGTDLFSGNDILAKGPQQQQQQKDGGYGNFKRRRVMLDGSTELCTDGTEYCDAGLPANNQHQTNLQDSMAMLPHWQQNYYESSVSQGQQGLQSSAEELSASQNGKSRTKQSGVEEEDEGLGNVVNVRYPYDWDQVSEVLFGGTPDFFQMPGF